MSENNKAFSYSYSGATRDELTLIKEKYTQKEFSRKMSRIRALDKRVDFIATMFSIFTGMMGTAFIGINIFLIAKDYIILPLGILLCVVGITIDAVVPFLHGRVHSWLKRYYSPEILTLIEEIEHNQF